MRRPVVFFFFQQVTQPFSNGQDVSQGQFLSVVQLARIKFLYLTEWSYVVSIDSGHFFSKEFWLQEKKIHNNKWIHRNSLSFVSASSVLGIIFSLYNAWNYKVSVVLIYLAFCLDVSLDGINGGPSENYTHTHIQAVPKRCIHTSNNCICEHFEEEDFYFQQDGTPPHNHRDVTSFLNERLPNRWIGRRGFVEYPPPVHQTSHHY